jgi:hypothetical protein
LDLPEALAGHFGPSADPDEALALTIWRGHPVPAQDPVLARLDHERVLIVREFDVSTLKLHIEMLLNPNDLPGLKRTASEYATSMLAFLKRHKLRCERLTVHICDTQGHSLATGRLHRKRDVVLSAVKDRWWAGIAIPGLTLLVRLAFSFDLKDAGVSAAAALVATILFTVLQSTIHDPKVQYDQ